MFVTLVMTVTVVVFLFVILSWLPMMQPTNAALQRWTRGETEGPYLVEAAKNIVQVFCRHHRLSVGLSNAVVALTHRPRMFPLMLCLKPTLVRFEQDSFVKGWQLKALMQSIVVIALVFPLTVGYAVNHPVLMLFPLLNIVAFILCWNLVKTALSELGTLNMLLSHSFQHLSEP
ncbi:MULTISPECIES: hypothetical protein [Serratia]|jgi:hypothetical protein|uniref:hypothetical protein n=1 Tax=Serratia TaxID=613 RepID=UPI00174756F2|nr:hypothetical protein [Serratia marcescens]EIG9090264.1 hypothetical protein [Serratia marcescens]MBN5380217.1 hypothetical protein [Serratia marcescens]CAI1988690.1 Uncharacterised protein [Serratia marcescens]HCR2979546.1 hypothetical protein [Serratia marcescens]